MDDLEAEIAAFGDEVMQMMSDDQLVNYVAAQSAEFNHVVETARKRGIEVIVAIGDDDLVRVGFSD